MSAYVSFFSIPPTSFDELTPMFERWLAARRAVQVDLHVIGNQLYRRADELAVARTTLEGDALHQAAIALNGYVFASVSPVFYQRMLTTDDCRELLQAMASRRERVADEDALMRKIWKCKHAPTTPDAVRHAYHAFLQALEQTVALDAGFLWVSYDDQAEAKLEQVQRRWAELAAARALRPPPTPEERVAELQAEIDRLRERGLEAQMRAEREHQAFMAEHSRRILYVVPAEHLDALRPLARKTRSAHDESAWPATRARAAAALDELDARLAEQALERISFDQAGERCAFEQIMVILLGGGFLSLPGLGPANLYAPDAVRRLERAMTEWIASQPAPRRKVDLLTALCSPYPREMCQHAYQTMRKLLKRTAKRAHAGLAVLTFVEASATRDG